MSISRRIPFIFGLVLTSLGSFLPWQVEGDFLSYWTIGLRVFPSFEDNGGLLFLVLSIALAFLYFKPPSFVERPRRWIIVFSAILTLTSIFHIASWVIDLSAKAGIVGAPMIQIGLIMVFIGSVTLLLSSLPQHRKVFH